jgi:uncharacterized protein YaiI (UPF0178 family)
VKDKGAIILKIIVDADACPVKDIIEELAQEYRLELIMVSNINHVIASQYAKIVVVDGTSEAADIAIVNLTKRGDIVVTQDYGLASLALAKGSYALDPLGHQYTDTNIEGLLVRRFINQKARRAGERIGGPRKRNPNDNSRFQQRLREIIQQQGHDWVSF